MIFDHLFTPKSKDTERDLTPKKRSNEEINENETIENLQNSVLSINAKVMALKSFVKDELYSPSKSTDRVRTKQCNQTDFMKEMKKVLEESKTKTEIIKTLLDYIRKPEQ